MDDEQREITQKQIDLILFGLNGAISTYPWKLTKARKEHESDNGHIIHNGEYYIASSGFNPSRLSIRPLWENFQKYPNRLKKLRKRYKEAVREWKKQMRAAADSISDAEYDQNYKEKSETDSVL